MKNNISKSFEINGKKIGAQNDCYVIAEAGLSHFGDFDKAIKLIDMAVAAKADCVKFQTFDVDEMVSSSDQKWKKRLAGRMLPFSDFEKLKQYCESHNITFISTAHDEKSLDFLYNIDVAAFKIGSGELGNEPFLSKIASFQKPIICSTGMYTMSDIDWTISKLTSNGNRDVAMLHCVTQYPTPPIDVNLNFLAKMKRGFGGVIGYSDHTEGYHIPLAAVALGASIIEKHITLEFDIPDAQDWKVSCGPQNLSNFVAEIRDIEKALGREEKLLSHNEIKNKEWATKSLVAARDIKLGQKISEDMLTQKRPGTGIPPREKHRVIGRITNTDISANSIITLDFFDE